MTLCNTNITIQETDWSRHKGGKSPNMVGGHLPRLDSYHELVKCMVMVLLLLSLKELHPSNSERCRNDVGSW